MAAVITKGPTYQVGCRKGSEVSNCLLILDENIHVHRMGILQRTKQSTWLFFHPPSWDSEISMGFSGFFFLVTWSGHFVDFMDDHYYFEKSIFLSSGWLCVYIISGQIIIFH